MADEAFQKMITDFTTNCANLLDMISSNFNNGLASIHKNYMELQSQYGKAHSSLLEQSQKANSDLLENMGKSFQALKTNLKQLHDNSKKQADEFFEKGIEDFKKSCEEIVKKFPILKPKFYEDTIKTLKESHVKSELGVAKCYKDLLAAMEKSYETALKQLAFPSYKEPELPTFNFHKLSLSGPSTSQKK